MKLKQQNEVAMSASAPEKLQLAIRAMSSDMPLSLRTLLIYWKECHSPGLEFNYRLEHIALVLAIYTH